MLGRSWSASDKAIGKDSKYLVDEESLHSDHLRGQSLALENRNFSSMTFGGTMESAKPTWKRKFSLKFQAKDGNSTATIIIFQDITN